MFSQVELFLYIINLPALMVFQYNFLLVKLPENQNIVIITAYL